MPELTYIRDDGGAGAIQVLSQLFKTTFELPPRIQAICWAQFWAWIGMLKHDLWSRIEC